MMFRVLKEIVGECFSGVDEWRSRKVKKHYKTESPMNLVCSSGSRLEQFICTSYLPVKCI